MRLIDEVCRFIKRKCYYFDVMSGVLTGLCLCMLGCEAAQAEHLHSYWYCDLIYNVSMLWWQDQINQSNLKTVTNKTPRLQKRQLNTIFRNFFRLGNPFNIKQREFIPWMFTFILMCRTTLSGDLSSSGVCDSPLLEASCLDSFWADLGESGKGI